MAKIDYDVGDLVVCVDARPHPYWGHLLTEGAVYTVVSMVFSAPEFHPLYGWDSGVGVFLAEVDAQSPEGFVAERFRKLPKKSQEFFTGEMQENRELVPAQ